MARVLKPGGMLALATDWAVAGIPASWCSGPKSSGLDRRPRSVARRADRRPGSGAATTVPVDLQRNPFETPHLLVEDTGTTFTSVFVFLEKGAA